ncbi:MAG: hypothetical protein ACI4O3_04375 [Oscillospiraceae bacterium]
MNRNMNVLRLAMAALLVAIGILIPAVSPVKIPLGPAGSFTLASHVAIFLAMFFSPLTAVAVSLGTTVGFLLSGFPFPVVLRALSHVVWAALGALWLKKHPDILYRPVASVVFCAVVAVVHALLETVVIMVLFFSGSVMDQGGLWLTVFLPVGVVTLIHSSVDYAVALLVWRPIRKLKSVRSIAAVH